MNPTDGEIPTVLHPKNLRRTPVLAALPDALAPRKVLSQGLGASQAKSFFLGENLWKD